MPSEDCVLGNPINCISGDPNKCGKPKVPADPPLDPVVVTFVQGGADFITITWDNAVSYPGQIVKLMWKLAGSDQWFPYADVGRDVGTYTITSLTPNKSYDFIIRPEDADQYGVWVWGYGITDPAWDSDADTVEHLGEPVFHGDDVVLYS